MKGRMLLHNVLLTQEMIRLYKRKTEKPSCILKIVLRKAYDTSRGISYKRCYKSLLSRKWFMFRLCSVSTYTYSSNINGNATGFFKGSRGIR